jgi:lipopolysaccharide transport system permease protein
LQATKNNNGTLPPPPQGHPHRTASSTHRVVIRPSSGWSALRLGETWEYRELLYFMAWRDVILRYKQTAFGVGWVVVQPLATTLLFSILLGSVARLPSQDVPYPVFVMAGFVPWSFFSSGVMRASSSLVNNANLITKIYFPRAILPTASVLAGLVDMAIVVLLFVAFLAVYGILPPARVMFAPIFLGMSVMATLGVGLWLAALNVRFRDVGAIIPFATQLWLYITPVVYPAALVPEPWRALYGINPIAGAISGFRWATLGAPLPSLSMMLVSALATVLAFVTGVLMFRRVERSFADVI